MRGGKKVKIKQSENIRNYFSPKIKVGTSEMKNNLPQNDDIVLNLQNSENKLPLMIGQVTASYLNQYLDMPGNVVFEREDIPASTKPNEAKI